MIRRYLALSILSGLFILVVCGGAFAVDRGTNAGVVITSEGYENYIDYEDIAGNAKATIYGTTLETTVLAIYGLDGLALPSQPLPGDQTTDPNVYVYYPYYFINVANTTDAFSVKRNDAYTGSYGTNWHFSYIVDDNQDGVLDPDETTQVSWPVSLAEDADFYFILLVTPDATAGSGSYCTSTITIECSGSPSGEYTGANGNLYGGPGFQMDEVITDVQAPTVSLTRTATVDTPAKFVQVNNKHYPIPGAMVTITMTYTNEGNATAEEIAIVDRVPSGHQAGHVNASGKALDGGAGNLVNITTATGDATGWTVYYTTEATLTSAQRLYGDATVGWVCLGTLEAGTEFWEKDSASLGPLPLTATFIKWEKGSVEPDESAKLTWGYIIR